jgi:hypothetical protein
MTTTSPLLERLGTIVQIFVPDEPITGADTPPMTTSIFETSVPKLLPSMNTKVRTAPSLGEKSVNVTGFEGSEETTGGAPSYPPSSLQLVVAQPTTTDIAIKTCEKLFLILLSISVFLKVNKYFNEDLMRFISHLFVYILSSYA